jgi:hypothetical protein
MFSAMDRPISARRIPKITAAESTPIPVYIKRLSSPMRMLLRPIKRIVKYLLDSANLLPLARRTRELIPAYKRYLVHKRKENVINEYRKGFSVHTFVETGTYRGQMVSAVKGVFSHIYSIELGEELCRAAQEQFKKDRHVSIHCGDSAEVLPTILTELTEPTLFWLDAHYSYGDTAKAEIETPIEKELQSILNHAIPGHVILVDDARCFDGSHDYPTLGEVESLVHEAKNSYTFFVENDIIRIFPKETRS